MVYTLLVLLEPVIHGIPVEADEIRSCGMGDCCVAHGRTGAVRPPAVTV